MLKNYFIYVTSLFLIAVVVPLALQQSQQPQEIRQRAQSANTKFITLPPGSALPSDAECTSRVRRSSWEPRPENQQANNTNVYAQGYRLKNEELAGLGYESRVTGNFTGTTDEIIQWGACKWGFDEEIIRAVAVQESSWKQSTLGDCRGGLAETNGCQSVGLLQVKGADTPPTFPGTYPYARTSTAFNVDFALAMRRACFEGKETWLGSGYAAGDEWGCVGRWFSGNWYDSGAEEYIEGVKNHLAQKPWNDYGAGPAPTGSSINPTGGNNPTKAVSPTTPSSSGVTPTIYCVGGVGAPPCAPISSPTASAPTGSITPGSGTPPIGGTNPTSNPTPSIDPCATESSTSIMHNKKHKKHRGGNNGGGFFQRFFEFLFRLIEWLMERSGMTPPSGNPGSPTEPTEPCPEPTDEPEPTESDEPEPTTGTQQPSPTIFNEPTTLPSVTVSPGPSASACVAPAGQELQDQDFDDSQLPWQRNGADKVIITFETRNLTADWIAEMQKGITAWNRSACLDTRLVDTCQPNTNCVTVSVASEDEVGADGNFNSIESGGFTTGGHIELSSSLTGGAKTNVTIHEMGHAVGLRHRLTERVLMNGDTYDDVFDPDEIDFQNLLVLYGNQ